VTNEQVSGQSCGQAPKMVVVFMLGLCGVFGLLFCIYLVC